MLIKYLPVNNIFTCLYLQRYIVTLNVFAVQNTLF